MKSSSKSERECWMCGAPVKPFESVMMCTNLNCCNWRKPTYSDTPQATHTEIVQVNSTHTENTQKLGNSQATDHNPDFARYPDAMEATKPVDELRNRLWYLLDSHAAANYNLIVSEDDSEEEEQAVTQKDRYRIEIEALLTEARIDELKWVKSRSAKHAGIWIDTKGNELDERLAQLNPNKDTV